MTGDSGDIRAHLQLAAAAVEAAQRLEHRERLTSKRTRNFPRLILRQLRNWQKALDAVDGATIPPSEPNRTRGTRQRTADARSSVPEDGSPAIVSAPASPDQPDRQAVL
jgi:hypothetical protein